ncbi:MAG: DNA polymerase III subunit delta', partial [Desulfovibrio sp.]|nr:DNA polymerase III subunit delta' [Desulfovibrio sp.]
VLMGIMKQDRVSAANALLKFLEEPSPTTVFVLLAAQREQLLPTLVSRSFCLTLPWPVHHDDTDMRDWEETLAGFVQNGTGFLNRTSAKGSVDATLASRLLLCCTRAMSRLLAGEQSHPLDAALEPLDDMSRVIVCRWLNEAQQALHYGVTPARVVEAFGMRLFTLCHSAQRPM